MANQVRSRQRGISFIGLLIVGGLLAVTAVIGAEAFPTVVEFQAVQKAVNKAAAGNSVPEVRTLFDKAANIDNIKSISGKDLDVTKDGEKVVVSFAYQREIHLAGPAWLTLKYEGRSK
jgi:hypothetical protein